MKKRSMKHHKPHHNGKNRRTGKRSTKNRAFEPGDGKKNNKPKRIQEKQEFLRNSRQRYPDLSEEEHNKKWDLYAKKQERMQKRNQAENEARQRWQAEKQDEHEPCCITEEERQAKDAWLLEQLKGMHCDVVICDSTGAMIGKVIPQSFERRADVKRHMRHFSKVAEQAGFNRHWR
jgi:hypothetical protein